MKMKIFFYFAFAILLMVLSLKATDHLKPVMEPYKLMGKRLVFTNWFYVRAGHFYWLDEEGNKVNTDRESMIDEHSARFVSHNVAYGIRLFSEQAQREIPFIPTDKPWDKRGIMVHTLIHEDGKFRLWAGCYSDQQTSWYCYLESKDGIHWEKPNLGLVEFEGSRENNLLNVRFEKFTKEAVSGINTYSTSRFSVFVDPNAPSEERYKTLWKSRITQDEFQKKYKETRNWSYYAIEKHAPEVDVLRAAVSADGYKWKYLPDPLTFEMNDTQNIGYFDQNLQKYVLYTRNHMVGSRAPGIPYPKEPFHRRISRRAIGRTESENFKQFPLSEVIIETENDMQPSDHFYTNCYTQIPGAPDHHLMFPVLYNAGDDDTDLLLYSSYNGKTWHRVPGPPVLASQPFGEPDGGCFLVYPNLVERPNGDWILPYDGYNVPHKYARGTYRFEPGLLVWPKGRLMGIEAVEMGEFATVGFLLPGKKLKINALTQRAGHIKVELVEFDGKPIEGYSFAESDPIIGDKYWTELTWKGSAEFPVKPGTPIWLRFKLSQAKIYGLEFE
jgi:hypothetical protein